MDQRKPQKLGLLNFEELWEATVYLVYYICMEAPMLDEEGNYIGFDENRFEQFMKTRYENPIVKNLDFRGNKELRKLSISEAMELTAEEINTKYLSAVLPTYRRIMRTDYLLTNGFVVADDVPDDYLDAMFAMAWKCDLKIWAVQGYDEYDQA